MQGLKSISETLGRAKEYDLTSKTMTEEQDDVQMKNRKGTEICGLGKRHLVFFWCFFYFFIVNAHITVLPTTIVAMVNHSQPTNEVYHRNTSTTGISCPLPVVTEDVSTKPKQEGTFNWDSQSQGYALGVGFIGYMISNLFAGRVAEMYGAKRTIWFSDLCVIVCASISPFAAGWSIYAFIVVLFIRGFAQGAIFPSIFVMMANWFPRNERGFLSSFAFTGFAIGSAVSGIVCGTLCDIPSLGWPSAFYFMAGFNFCISIIYLLTFYEVPKIHPHITKEELKYIVDGQESDMSRKRPSAPWREICTSIPVHALSIGKTGFCWAASHFVYMHPTFMGTVLHFSMTENGLNTSLLFTAMFIGIVISMVGSNWLRKKNYLGVDQIRKWCNSISAFGFSICVVGVLAAKCDKTTNLVCCFSALLFTGFGISGSVIAGGDMSPTFSGSISGMSSCVAMFISSFMPVIVGALTKNGTLDEWHVVFGIHIAVSASCGLFFHIFGSADIQPWNSIETLESSNPKTPTANQTGQMKKSQIGEDNTTTNYI